MITRRLNLEQDFGIIIDCAPAVASLNPIYEAAMMTYVQPHSLAMSFGKFSDERALELHARVYEASVIVGSPMPEIEAWGADEWIKWAKENPRGFGAIRSICEAKINFDRNNEGKPNGQDRGAGAAA